MRGLFRDEVFESRQREWLGSIRLTRPPSLAWLVLLVLVAAGLTAAFLTLGEYTRKARVTGYLVPDRGMLRLMPPQVATVVEAQVSEGRAVHRGDVLFVLAVGQATLRGDTQAAVQESLVARRRSLEESARERLTLDASQSVALGRQADDMRREMASIGAEIDLQQQRLTLAQQAQARLESLRGDNFVSASQVQAKSEEMLGVKAQIQALERQRSAQLREIGVVEAQRRELPLKARALRGEVERDIAALAQQSAESEARQRIVVLAPQDGVMTSVLAQVGQTVNPGVAMASLLPADAKLQAHLFAPSSAVGFVRQNQAVQLRYQAFPYQKFGHQSGMVAQVARAPLQASELSGLPLQGAPAAGAEPLYRITVTLDRQTVAAYGEAQPLSPGMQLEADVLLDRRRLIEWLFEPVLGIAGRV